MLVVSCETSKLEASQHGSMSEGELEVIYHD